MFNWLALGVPGGCHLAKVQQVLSGVVIVASVPRSLTSGRNLRSFDVFKLFPGLFLGLFRRGGEFVRGNL